MGKTPAIGSQEIYQNVKTRIRSFKNDWFLDADADANNDGNDETTETTEIDAVTTAENGKWMKVNELKSNAVRMEKDEVKSLVMSYSRMGRPHTTIDTLNIRGFAAA